MIIIAFQLLCVSFQGSKNVKKTPVVLKKLPFYERAAIYYNEGKTSVKYSVRWLH